ncbi:MAG: histidinol-phosphate transaminase [Flavobacteriaceae bacterium]
MSKEFNIENLVRENVKSLKPYSSARDEYDSSGAGMVFMDANENPFDNGVNRYPDPHQLTLKVALAEHKKIDPKNILLGNGSDEVLDLLFRAFCEPKTDNVITLPPTYGMYDVLAKINNVEVREVPLTAQFQPNLEAILDSIDSRSKLLFICSPNNPTGNSFDQDNIKKLLVAFKGLVVIDEAYIDFSINDSWTTELHQYPNLVVVQTLSKAYGLAGIRLGMAMASEQIIAILKKIKPPYNVNQLTQARALQRVLNKERVTMEVSEILEQKTLLQQILPKIGFVKHVYPSDANFILVKVDDANKRYAQLLGLGVVVRNRSSQPLCENTLRFTIGTNEENIKLITALKGLN